MSRSSAVEAWTGALDDLEAHLGLIDRFLAGETVELQPYERSDGLGPLPSEERGRATTLRSATSEIDERLSILQAELAAGAAS